MSYLHDIRCPTDITAPKPTGICDRCGFKFYLDDLPFQYDFRGGPSPVNIRLRVDEHRCLDEPQPQLSPIIIRGIEGYVKDARPPSYAQQAAEGPAPKFDFILDE